MFKTVSKAARTVALSLLLFCVVSDLAASLLAGEYAINSGNQPFIRLKLQASAGHSPDPFWPEASYAKLLAQPGQRFQACTPLLPEADIEPTFGAYQHSMYLVTGKAPSFHYQRFNSCPATEEFPYQSGPLRSTEPFFILLLPEKNDKDKSGRFPIPQPFSPSEVSVISGYSGFTDDHDFPFKKPKGIPLDTGWKNDLAISVTPEADLQLFYDRLRLLANSFSKQLPLSWLASWFANGQNHEDGSLAQSDLDSGRLVISVRVNGGPAVRVHLSRAEWQPLKEALKQQGLQAIVQWLQPHLNGRNNFTGQLLSLIDGFADPLDPDEFDRQQAIIRQLETILELQDAHFSLAFENQTLLKTLVSHMPLPDTPEKVVSHPVDRKSGASQRQQGSSGATDSVSGHAGASGSSSFPGGQNPEDQTPEDQRPPTTSRQDSQLTNLQSKRVILIKRGVTFLAEDSKAIAYVCTMERRCCRIRGNLEYPDAYHIADGAMQNTDDENGSRICSDCFQQVCAEDAESKKSFFKDKAACRNIESIRYQCLLCKDREGLAYHSLEQHVESDHLYDCQECHSEVILSSISMQSIELHERKCCAVPEKSRIDEVGLKKRKRELSNQIEAYDAKIGELCQRISDLKSEINHVHREISVQLQPVISALGKADTAIQNLQEGFSELALMVQVLQATSYNGVFIWKVPEVHRRRSDAKSGKTISLYSAPFYTCRHGYKACLRLYMDGDGCGKSTHLSFFIAIMRGEYDALLRWPFRQTVTLTLLDQDDIKNISQQFQPEPTSCSFQRPRNEMNIASGCPMFAPLSVLNCGGYVKEDTLFLKCEINKAGIKDP